MGKRGIMAGIEQQSLVGRFDAMEFLALARERGVNVARDGSHVKVELGSASWRDWLALSAAAEDHEAEILGAMSTSN